MAYFNSFRVLILSTIVLIVWFAFASERNSARNIRQAASLPSTCSSSGSVALTFDEGPGQPTQSVLNSLQKNKLKATFHVVTQYLSQGSVSSLVQQAFNQGHLIGQRFPTNLNPTTMSDQDIINTLTKDSDAIYSLIKKYPKYLRLPYGQFDSRVINICTSLGYVVTSWNIDVADYINGASIVDNMRKQISVLNPGAGQFIVLFHDISNVYNDGSVLDSVASLLANTSYQTVTLDICVRQDSYRAQNNPNNGKSSGSSNRGFSVQPETLGYLSVIVAALFVMM